MAIERNTGMARIRHQWRLMLVLAIVAGGLVWGGWKFWEVRRYRRAMSEISADLEAGRNGRAARNLVALLAWRPDSDEAAYLLGMCEKARGRTEAASKAWTRVPPGSSFALQAIQGRMELQVERGRLADAEQLIKNAMADPRGDTAGLRLLLGPVYSLEGRVEEAVRFIEASWDHLAGTGQAASDAAISLVRLHIEQQRMSTPVEAVRAFLDQAARLAPQDDRMWLGKANLAIRVGSYDEAARWLDACLGRRPDDVSVWRTQLDWAVATNRIAEAEEALKHLPVAESTPAQVPRLAAWLAARRGDREPERRALERLIGVNPADLAALDRLADLADRAGQPARAAELRRKRSEIDQLKARYQKLYQRNQPTRDAEEIARLAEKLGRWFEARVFLTVATAVDPDRDDLRHELARLNQRGKTMGRTGRTLADLLATELGDDHEPSPPPVIENR